MPIGAYGLLLPGIALILLGMLYLRRGTLPRPEPYRKGGEWGKGHAVPSDSRPAKLAAGTALVIAGIILILFFAAVPSLFPLF